MLHIGTSSLLTGGSTSINLFVPKKKLTRNFVAKFFTRLNRDYLYLDVTFSTERSVIFCWNVFAVVVVHLTVLFILLYLPFGLNLCISDPCSSVILVQSPIMTVVGIFVVPTPLVVMIFVAEFPVLG